MLTIGLIKEGKQPQDNRVALTPAQCKWLKQHVANIRVIVQACPTRCYSNVEYQRAGIEVLENIDVADILFGIKEVPKEALIPNKKYYTFFIKREGLK